MTADWKPRDLPRIELTWECAACRRTERDGIGCTILPRPGDELDVVLCEHCHAEPNIEIATKGVSYTMQDGTPTYLLGDAVITDNLVYRYHLRRRWLRQSDRGTVLWVLLNPSTADDVVPDPTIHRVIGFTHRWRYSALEVVNLFAYRTPFPHLVPNDIALAVGPENDRHIYEAMKRADVVIAGWGKPGKVGLCRMVDDRVAQLRALAAAADKELMALATTQEGAPRHPLARGIHRIPDQARPVPWRPAHV